MNLESGGQFGDYQNEIYLDGLPTMPMAFDELEARAQAAFLQWGQVPRMPACSAVAPQTVSD